MKNLFNDIPKSEKQRILEMHKNKGYSTIISESPMDSMFYPGDDYVKDAGQSLSYVLQSVKEKVKSIPDKVLSELPNLDEIINNVNNFFGGDITKMSKKEIEDVLSLELKDSSLMESWIDDYDKFDSPHYSEKLDTKLSDVEGGLIQKALSLVGKIFGVNILSFGLIGSILSTSLNIATVSPTTSLVVSIIAMFIISVIRRILYFKERNK